MNPWPRLAFLVFLGFTLGSPVGLASSPPNNMGGDLRCAISYFSSRTEFHRMADVFTVDLALFGSVRDYSESFAGLFFANEDFDGELEASIKPVFANPRSSTPFDGSGSMKGFSFELTHREEQWFGQPSVRKISRGFQLNSNQGFSLQLDLSQGDLLWAAIDCETQRQLAYAY